MFEESIGMPFPSEMLPYVQLAPVFGDLDDSPLVGTPPAVEHPCLEQGDIETFIASGPDGYVMVGFWGHGVNSYAFYYVLADSWRKVFLRLPYGGVYMDNDEQAKLIRSFLPAYAEFERLLQDKAESLEVVDSMGEGHYRVRLKDGRVLERQGSMLQDPGFRSAFGI